VASALAYEATWGVPNLGLLLLLGESTYAIYLLHEFIVSRVVRLAGPVAVVVSASILGVVVTRLVERPLLRFLRRRTRRVVLV
jgi:peptidoglycan/LPS O-acetylase OafA/YrhL